MSGSYDQTIKIWSSITLESIVTIEDHTGYVKALTVLLNGNLVSGSADNT